jgi:hypothetical protein
MSAMRGDEQTPRKLQKNMNKVLLRASKSHVVFVIVYKTLNNEKRRQNEEQQASILYN